MSDFSLKAVFGLDATGLKTELRSLRNDVSDFAENVAKIGLAAAAAAFVALSRDALKMGEALKDSSEQVGINVEALQVLNYLAEQNGSSQEVMQKGLIKTRAFFAEATVEVDKHADTLQALGLNIEAVSAMPLERKMQAIAIGYTGATDKAAAYNAISQIFGEKIAPKMIESLKALAEEGFPAAAASAREAGHMFETSTIAGLEAADQAIANFKKRATIAVGEIIVNFRTEEGIALMKMQLTRAAGSFATRIADVPIYVANLFQSLLSATWGSTTSALQNKLIDVASSVAAAFNRILPENMQINVGNLDELRMSQESFGSTIARAISNTNPTALTDAVFSGFDDAIKKQKEVVTALNAGAFQAAVTQLDGSGERFAVKIDSGAKILDTWSGGFMEALLGWAAELDNLVAEQQAVADAMTAAAEESARAAAEWAEAGETGGTIMNIASASQLAAASNDALRALLEQSRSGAQTSEGLAAGFAPAGFGESGRFAAGMEAFRLNTQADRVQAEIDMRRNIQQAFAMGGAEAVFRAFPTTDPLVLDKMLDRFGRNVDETTRSANTLDNISRGLTAVGIIPRT